MVTLGIKGAHTLKQSWFIAGPFTLTRTGDFDISGIVEAYEKALANAQAVDQSAPMDEEVLAALQAAIAAEVDKTSPNALTEAINTLNEATAAAKASIAEKAAIKAIADAAGHELDDTNVYTAESYATFMEAAEAIKAKYADGTLTLAEANEYKNSVWNTGWHSANTIDDVLLSSWTIGGAQATDYNTALYINTWSVEGDGDGTNFKVPFFEYWTGDGNPLGANVIQATVTGLEPGKPYQAEAWVRLRKNDVSITDNGITFAVGDGEAIALDPTTAGMNQLFCDVVSATGNADAEGNLTITFDVAEGNNVSWLSFKNVNTINVIPDLSLAMSCNNKGKVIINGGVQFTNDMSEVNVYDGANNTFVFTPEENCQLEQVLIDGLDVTLSVKNNQLTTKIRENSKMIVTFSKSSGDMNGDGMVNISDVVALVNLILGQ